MDCLLQPNVYKGSVIMATEDNENGTARRLRVRRRGSGGFVSGGSAASSRSESLRAPAEHEQDDIDDAIDPESVRNHIVARASAPMPAAAPTGELQNPRMRMAEVADSGSRAYAKEYRLNLLHRLLLRNIPLDVIARQLGVSLSTAEKDRAELKKRLRETAKELDINEMIGAQTGLYDEVSGMAMRIAANNSGEHATPIAMQLAAMRTTLAANADKSRFYHSAGVYDVLRFRRAEDGTSQSDIQLLMQRTAAMMESLNNSGFDEFTVNDAEDDEVMDL